MILLRAWFLGVGICFFEKNQCGKLLPQCGKRAAISVFSANCDECITGVIASLIRALSLRLSAAISAFLLHPRGKNQEKMNLNHQNCRKILPISGQIVCWRGEMWQKVFFTEITLRQLELRYLPRYNTRGMLACSSEAKQIPVCFSPPKKGRYRWGASVSKGGCYEVRSVSL